jgi:ubiquitin carboxyl-terminal hydrolase 22/27/51
VPPLELALTPTRVAASQHASFDLQSIFNGTLRSEVRCARCGNLSTKFEDFRDISLDMTRAQGLLHESLGACLKGFTREECLTSGERYWCASCGGQQEAAKQLSIQRLPNVLCFHLKRFKQSASAKQTSSKIDNFVGFPLHSLDMQPFTSSRVCARYRTAAAATGFDGPVDHAARDCLALPPEPAPEHMYDLFGIAIHHGTMQNGHYTSYVRRQASWFHCDDSTITPAQLHEVRHCRAYMLFYMQKRLGGTL